MTIIHAMILGLVEGITEFLPISSTAHLIITSNLLSLQQTDFNTFFEVFIQSGAILAVVVLYFRYMLKHFALTWKIIASFIPTAIVGLLLHDVIKNIFFKSTAIISISLISIGLVFILVELGIKKGYIKGEKSLKNLTYTDALLIGLVQSCAIFPGVSRAGAVIVGMMFLKYKRTEAALYSFLLAVPTILAATVLDMLKTDRSLFTSSNIALAMIGFVISFCTAILSVRWLVGYLQKNTLVGFGIYRIIVGILLFI